jgi:hypothetical protein
MSPYEAVILFEVCVDSTLTRIDREGEIPVAVSLTAMFTSFVTKFTEESRSMGRSPRSSPGDPGHLKGFEP